MKKQIITIAGILCIPISCAFAYTAPECTLPIDVFQEYAKSHTSAQCDPKTITKIEYYSNFRGWMVFGENGNKNKCIFKLTTDLNTVIDSQIQGGGSCSSSSLYTILTNKNAGLAYGCTSDNDCDTANGWVCQEKSSTYGVGICKQTSCGSKCNAGTVSAWKTSSVEGYEEQTTVLCNTYTDTTYSNYYCSGSVKGRCAKGYYGVAKVAPYSGCTQCPEHNESGEHGTTASAGNTNTITSCYIPSTVTWSFSDTTGSGIIRCASDAYYKN